MPNTTYEYQEISSSKLKECIEASLDLKKYFKKEWNTIKARHYCGIVNYEDQDYYILPKVAKKDECNLDIFMYMLRYTYDIELQNEDISTSQNQKNHNFLEVFIQLFAKNLLKEFTRGVYKEYITCKENLNVLKGKYLVDENCKYNHTKDKIYCEFDELSMDNTLNQFFLFAIKTLLPFVKNKKLLKQCELVLDEVTYKNLDSNSFLQNFNRINARYKESYEFALLLLKKFIPLFQDGKKSFAFLFDMNELFEKFIGKLYKEIDKTTKLQKVGIYGNLVLKPDIYTSTCIIDTKYKKVKNKEDLKRDDKYQMFVYGTNFERKKTMLLYPEHLFYVKEDLSLGKEDKIIHLKMRSIALDFQESKAFDGEYKEYIKEMKKRIGEISI